MSRAVELEDLYRFKVPSDPQISPDGSRVAYVVTTVDRAEDSYRTSIFVTPADGGPGRELTTGPKDAGPRWSPDGTRLAFVSARGGGSMQLFVMDLAGGDARPLTALPLGAGAAVWSPDGSHLAFVAPVDLDGPATDDNDKGRRATAPVVVDRLGFKADGAGLVRGLRTHLFTVPADGSQPATQLTWGDWSVGGAAWTPNGKTLVLSGARGEDLDLEPESAIYALELDGGAPQRLTEGKPQVAAPLIAGDGRRVVCGGATTVDAGHTRLYALPVDGGPLTTIAPDFDRNVMLGAPGYPGGNPALFDEDRQIVFCARDRGCTHVYTVASDAGAGVQPRKIVGGADRTVSGLSLSAVAQRVAFVAATTQSPGEVYVADTDGGNERQLTHFAADALDGIEILEPAERTFTAADGTAIHGWVLRHPATKGPSPLLLDIHGGPHNAWSPVFDGYHLYHQALAQDGWTILFINPRGSDGYGEGFYRAVVHGWGTSDDGDFHAALDGVIAEGLADPARLAVTGYSYGGFMTCWLTSTSDRFAAAVPGGCVSDLATEFGTADLGLYLAQVEIGDTPTTAPERFEQMSPVTRVGNVTTPTLLLHGESDDRCPVSQAEEWFAALRARRVPCELVRYPGASHLFIVGGKPSHRIDYSRRLAHWVTAHTSGRADTGTLARVLAGYQARFDALASKYKVPGAQLAVLRGDEIFELATGVADLDSKTPVSLDTRFQIGSITKVFTATLMMQLVERGLVDLDKPVTAYLPDFRLADDGGAITVRHLLTHTSGIPGDLFVDTGTGEDAIARFVARLADEPSVHPAGAMFSYSNGAFAVAGRVIEAVTGQPFADVLRTALVDRLGLSLRTATEDIILGPHAIGHVPDAASGGLKVAPLFVLMRNMTSAGSTPAATARDLVVFARMHLDDGRSVTGEEVLSPASVKAMQERQVAIPGPRHTAAGLAWGLAEWEGERVISHNGGTVGQYSVLTVLADRRVAIGLVTNGPTGPAMGLEIQRDLFGELAGVVPPGLLTPPDKPATVDLDRYTGTYDAVGSRWKLTVEDGALMARVESLISVPGLDDPDAPPLRLTPLDESTFIMPPGVPVSFLDFDESGRPRYLFSGRVAQRSVS